MPLAHEYHEHVAALNQLLTIALQLERDLKAHVRTSSARSPEPTQRPTPAHAPQVHKYAAHKLALLYHAVNLSKFRRDELRRCGAIGCSLGVALGCGPAP